MLQLEAQAQQDALLENARLDLRMAHRAEIDRLELAQFLHRAVRQDLAGLQVAFAAEIVVVPVEFESELRCGRLAHLDGFAGDFRPGAVAADDCDVVSCHVKSRFPLVRERGILLLWRGQAMDF